LAFVSHRVRSTVTSISHACRSASTGDAAGLVADALAEGVPLVEDPPPVEAPLVAEALVPGASVPVVLDPELLVGGLLNDGVLVDGPPAG
jgi:hypothetical protein